jgi:(R,R)-butanediol dehydrogenase/meso-butanediol dehydrogenase/diacetyl reductase
MAYPLPGELSLLQGALVEPMSVGMTAALRADAAAGETVAIHGCGPIGIGVLLALRAHDVDVIVSDPSALRRAIASRLGASVALDPFACDAASAIRELTNGNGASASVEVAGVAASVNAAIQSTAEERRVVIVSMPSEPIEIDLIRLHAAKLFLTTSTGTTPIPESFRQVMELMVAGRYPHEGWTETIPYEGLIESGFEPLHRAEKVKLLVDMSL